MSYIFISRIEGPRDEEIAIIDFLYINIHVSAGIIPI